MENLKKKIESKIARKLDTDPGFRKALLDNPGKAIKEDLGISFPAGVDVAVKDEVAGGISLIFTEGPKGTEIQDELLEQVAAGCVGEGPWDDL